MKRKSILWTIVVGMILTLLCSCASETEPKGEIAYLYQYSVNQEDKMTDTIDDTLKNICKEKQLSFLDYRLTTDTQDYLRNSIQVAYAQGAKVIFVNEDLSQGTKELCKEFPEITFVILNDTLESVENENLYAISFDRYELGYTTGYFLARSDRERIGYIQDEKEGDLFYTGFLYGLEEGRREAETNLVLYTKLTVGEEASAKESAISGMIGSGVSAMTYYGLDLHDPIENICLKTTGKLVPTVLSYRKDDQEIFAVSYNYHKAIDDILDDYQNKAMWEDKQYKFGLENEGILIELFEEEFAQKNEEIIQQFLNENLQQKTFEEKVVPEQFDKLKFLHLVVNYL